MASSLVKLLTKNYNNCTAQHEIDEYIRDLRKACIDLKLKNDFLLEKRSYLPIVCLQTYCFNDNKLNISDFETISSLNCVAITLTFDPKKFPQLIITPQYDQILYIQKVISNYLYGKMFNQIYGSFELQQNGNVHFHGIAPYYDEPRVLQSCLAAEFTNRNPLKQNAVLVKPVNDLEGWLTYINKESNDYLEYGIKKKCLEI